jgi:hypothetical protein
MTIFRKAESYAMSYQQSSTYAPEVRRLKHWQCRLHLRPPFATRVTVLENYFELCDEYRTILLPAYKASIYRGEHFIFTSDVWSVARQHGIEDAVLRTSSKSVLVRWVIRSSRLYGYYKRMAHAGLKVCWETVPYQRTIRRLSDRMLIFPYRGLLLFFETWK